ncbi:MAG TPA: HAMP domain-containing protein, partial [Sphingomonas sp.]
MGFLENTKILPKMVALLLLLGAITLFIGWNGASRIRETSTEYTSLVDVAMPNTTRMARINARMNAVIYAAYRGMMYDGASQRARDAQTAMKSAYASATTMMAEIKSTEPGAAAEVDLIAGKAEVIYRLAAEAMNHGLVNDNDAARRVIAQADPLMDAFSADMQKRTTSRNATASGHGLALAKAGNSTSTTLLAMGVVGVVVGVGLAFLVIRSGITGPLSRLQGQMGEIAAGDYAKDVEGTTRGDEVGAMAKAVRVFRENGIAKEAADKAKARADAEQKVVVDTVSAHLAHLSDGDLTASIRTDFPGDYAILKTNFNEAL